MNLVEEFKINSNDSIKILVPDFINKFNYYYRPTDKLHVFDQIKFVFQQGQQEFNLAEDMVDIIVSTFKTILENILNKNIILNKKFEIGQLGLMYNINTKKEEDGFMDFSSFSVCSNASIGVWLYSRNNQIYLEISPMYPWFFMDQNRQEARSSFKKFIKAYKPIMVEEISEEIAKKWLDQCNQILEKLIK